MFNNTNVNLNLYKSFYDAAKYGSFSKAAEFTYTTQSAISKAVKKLEEELDTTLFYRKPHGIELTEKGKELLYYVEKSYGNLLTAERVMYEEKELKRGKLTIGLPSYISSFFFFDKIVEFHKKYPNIEISLINGPHAYLLDLLDKHQVDFIVYSYIETNNKEWDVVKLYTIQYKFFCRKDRYNEYKNIKSIKDLEDVPLVLPIKSTGNRRHLDEVFLKYGVNPKRTINIHTSEGILTGVKNDLGVGYIISDIIKDDDNFKLLDIKEKLREEDIILIYNKKFLTNAPIKFIEEFINIKIN